MADRPQLSQLRCWAVVTWTLAAAAAAGPAEEEPLEKSEPLPSRASRQLDSLIVDSLKAIALQDVTKENSKPSGTVVTAMKADEPPRVAPLTLYLAGREVVVQYTGDRDRAFNRGEVSASRPGVGALLKSESDFVLSETTISAGRLILRTKDGWVIATTPDVVSTLAKSLAEKRSSEARATAAAGCELLGKDAAPLAEALLSLPKPGKRTLLQSRELISAMNALAAIGDPSCLEKLNALRKKAKQDAELIKEIDAVIKELEEKGSDDQKQE